jgi:poly(A) polymerase
MQDDFVRKRTPKRAQKLLEQQNFRASFDFLLLRSKIYPEQCLEYANWWQEFQVADADKQLEMTKVNKTRTSYRRYKPKKSTNDA